MVVILSCQDQVLSLQPDLDQGVGAPCFNSDCVLGFKADLSCFSL